MSVDSIAKLPETSASQEVIDELLNAELGRSGLREGRDFWVNVYGESVDLVFEGIGAKWSTLWSW